MASQPKSILKTPTRKIRQDDFVVQPEDEEEMAYTEADLKVKDLTVPFRNFSAFTFKGQTRYRDGKLFLDRFRGNVKTHPNVNVRTILDENRTEAIPDTWNQTVYQALLLLTGDDAVDTVLNYPDDGVAAYKALYRMVFRLTAVNAAPDLKRAIAEWEFPTDRHPAASINAFRTKQRELVTVLPAYTDMEMQLADFKLAVPERYSVLLHTGNSTDPDSLGIEIVNYYESFLRHKTQGNRFGKRPGRQDAPQSGAIQDSRTFEGSGSNGGRGQARGRGGGNTGGRHAGGRGNGGRGRGRPDKPKQPCHICAGNHWTSACPHKAEVNQQFSGKTPKLAGAVDSNKTPKEPVQDAVAVDTYELAPLSCSFNLSNDPISMPSTTANIKTFKVDSGAQVHICNNRKWFTNLRAERRPTSGVAQTLTYTNGVGDIEFVPTTTNGVPVKILLKDVYYIPQQRHNLISYGKLVQAGFDVRLDIGKISHGDKIFSVPMVDGLFPWQEETLDDVAKIAMATTTPRVPRDRADWQILFSEFTKMAELHSAGDPRTLWIELFRKKGNEVCDKGYTYPDQDAFAHEWTGGDYYGNPVYEESFIMRTLDKALIDFAKDPQGTRFIFVLPEWKSASWFVLTRHFEIIRRWEIGTKLFSCVPAGNIRTTKLKSPGLDGSPGRYLADGVAWPVLAIYKDLHTHSTADDAALLHLRLGHPGENQMKHLLNYNHGLKLTGHYHLVSKHCAVCHAAKQSRSAAKSTTAELDQYKVFSLIHTDIFGPLPAAEDGTRYIIAFIDHNSRHATTSRMSDRSQSGLSLEGYIHWLKSLGYTIQGITVHSDNDTVYVNTSFAATCKAYGIQQKFTAPYRHTAAAIVERFWKTLLQTVRSLLFTSTFTRLHWSLAADHATYLYNRRPSSSQDMRTPYETVYQTAPDLRRLRVFGCEASVLLDEQHRDTKLGPRNSDGLYVGHDDARGGYKVYVPEKKKVVISADVKFIERFRDGDYGKLLVSHRHVNSFPLEGASELTALPPDFLHVEAIAAIQRVQQLATAYIDGATVGLAKIVTPDRFEGVPDRFEGVPDRFEGVWVYSRSLACKDSDPAGITLLRAHAAELLKRTQINEHYPIFQDCTVSFYNGTKQPVPGLVLEHRGKSYGIAYEGDFKQVTKGRVALASHTTTAAATATAVTPAPAAIITPKSYAHSKTLPDADEWEIATQQELNSIVEQNVIELYDRADIPADKNIVDSAMVYKTKLNKDGSLDKRKARMVAKGYKQILGEDYDETFAPVSQITTVRIIIKLCMLFSITPRHIDVKTAFLNARLKHTVYIRLPPGIKIGGKEYGKLLKSLYGLKQAGHDWHQVSEEFIFNFDSRFKRSEIDPCLYVIIGGDLIVFITTHVDDYIIASSCDEWYNKFKEAFGKTFTITDLGRLDHLLQIGLNWAEDDSTVTLTQTRYIKELATKYGLEDCRPMQTPMENALKLEPAEAADESLPYRNLVMALLWVARVTRPDIQFAVIYLTRFMNCFQVQHFVAAKRILRYLITTAEMGLTYRRNRESNTIANGLPDLIVTAYSDSDWASDANDRRSFSGCAIYLNGDLVSWASKKQQTVALSSVEAEYMALSDTTREVLYVTNLLKAHFKLTLPVPIRIDNKGAGYIAENNINNKMTKHIDVRHHFVRYYIKNNLIELFYVPTNANTADALTKALTPDVHKRHRDRLLGSRTVP